MLPGGHQAAAQQFRFLFREALLGFQQLPDGVINQNGIMVQPFQLPLLKAGHKDVVFIQPHLVGIGEGVDLSQLPGGVIPNVHGAAQRQHRGFLPLAGIDRRRQLGIAEAVHHPVVAHPVAGTEILVGGIVEHAPAEAAGVLPASLGRREHPGVAQGLFLPLLPGVEALGGEHVAVVLRDQQGLAHVRRHVLFLLGPRGQPVVGKVVVGVDVLQEMALFQIPHPGGGPAGVQLMGQGVGPGIEFIVVHALIDAHTPENDAGVVAVLQHHLPQVFQCLLLPGLVPDVLPARQLREHQQAQPVTFVNKMPALGIVGGAHRVALQLLLQNPGVLPLQTLRRSVADIGIALVPV